MGYGERINIPDSRYLIIFYGCRVDTVRFKRARLVAHLHLCAHPPHRARCCETVFNFMPMDIESSSKSGGDLNPYKRTKQPKAVRKALLDEAIKLIISNGLSAVTVQAVSAAAGVSKGGFLHHFPTKAALIDAVFRDLLDSIDCELDRYMANDDATAGVFTRAYVKVVLETDWTSGDSQLAALSIFMLTEPQLRDAWATWFNARLVQHDATDGDIRFALVRFATDGIWLSALANVKMPDRQQLLGRLLDAAKA